MEFVWFIDNVYMNIFAIIMLILFMFLFFLFIVFILSLFKKQKKIDFNPNISIIIPAYNEENKIANCIKSILNSNYKNYEIILVDDGSTDNTIKKAKEAYNDLIVIKAEHKGKVDALNLGVKKAKNEIVFCMDADVVLDKNAIKYLVQPLKENDVAATNALVLTKKHNNLVQAWQNVEYFYNNLIRLSFSKLFKNSIWFFGAVACYKKNALKKIGYFKKESLTEDMFVCLELYRNNYRIITVEKAIIYTDAMKSLKSLFIQRMRWYFGALQALIKNNQLLKNKKSSIPVLFLFSNQFWWTFFAFISFFIFSYQVYYWFPEGLFSQFSYLFRWFSILGPFYVLYKIPEGWLSFLNISGIFAGILTLFLSIISLIKYKGKFTFYTIIALFFYFPYTILLNTMIVFSIFKYAFSKKKYFMN